MDGDRGTDREVGAHDLRERASAARREAQRRDQPAVQTRPARAFESAARPRNAGEIEPLGRHRARPSASADPMARRLKGPLTP